MQLILSELPESLRHYTGKPIPLWMRRMHPTAARAVLELEKESGGLVYNDVWRSAEVSLWAMKSKSGVQPPGFSGHNYGLSIDFAVEDTLKARGWTYPYFYDFLEERGWLCHRRDKLRGSEDWHFNFLANDPERYKASAQLKRPATWSLPVETRILELYGDQFAMSSSLLQEHLKLLHMYSGDIDGDLGPLSREAIGAFQRAWGMKATGIPDSSFQRTLAFVTATKKVVAL